ncbi:5'-nucleotidase C-terminal domain-containing protein [Hymenobacter sp. BT770]|uniref:5'-nucleotidase C-terminal domain-containing protein n=1 Tax=Hymenobacter sp. BT770 TaxID=2886942 RepID=UPI001D0F4F04|nr:5'-nucleotidase C-terminal domain-containing protein [Hymenobacter sp. BT770]MCC3152604.1 5'-nucleotidase C-terminal domain-containing protein [Hymenobacter sp. BT770]MDO3414677.1 5'-nucleotidase C-terminal domain-containing protein [Hymenobacter sp. BT770]
MRFRRLSFPLFPVLALALAAGCQRAGYAPTAHFAPATSQVVGKTQAEDPAVAALIAPYHDRVTSQMQEVIGNAPAALTKMPGESPLANFVADLQRARASQALGQPIPLGVMTNGGLRAGFAAGPITLGSVFELMPFENELVVLDAPGPVVQQLFEYAAHIKMAVSGATYAVTFDGLPKDIRIGGQPFDPNQDKTWPIAISDYLATGGDNMVFFKTLTPRHTNILLRTAIADHIRALTKAGQPVTAKVEGRVKQ